MNNDITKIYVFNDADRRYYEERQDEDGEYEYLLADPDLQFEELTTIGPDGQKVGTGKFMEVNDLAERKRQLASDSHQRYFKALSEDPDPKTARRALKRLDKLEEQMQQLAIDRVSPVGVPQVRYVKDEQFMEYMGQYQKAVAKGETKDPSYSDHAFVPLSHYQHKLTTSKGRVIRPLYQGEVGMYGFEIIVLEAGYGTGNTIAVPTNFGNGPRQE